jgi:uncharacterized protein YkwD
VLRVQSLRNLLFAALIFAVMAISPAFAAASRPAGAAKGAAKRAHRSSACHATHRRSARGARRFRAKHGSRCRARGHSRRGVLHARHVRAPAPASNASTAAVGAATIAAVLAVPCQGTELMPAPENVAVVRNAILCLINRVRAQHGELPLALSAPLEQAAEEHAGELVAQDYFAHVAPDGETPVDRARGAGYIANPSDGYVIGENLAWGTYGLATPASVVSAWVASPGHLANILESQYRETGIGVLAAVPTSLAAGAPGATYAQEFGVLVS